MRRVDEPSLLKRLFELGAGYSGQVLSYDKMLGQLRDAGNTTTLARYLDLLENAGLIAGLPKYARGEHRRKGSSPKLNVLDTTLIRIHPGLLKRIRNCAWDSGESFGEWIEKRIVPIIAPIVEAEEAADEWIVKRITPVAEAEEAVCKAKDPG